MAIRDNRKIGMSLLILGALFFCLFIDVGQAQVIYENTGQRGIKTYNGPGNRLDAIYAMKRGAAGAGWDLFCAGYCARDANYNSLLAIRLDDVTGDTVWTYKYAGPQTRSAVGYALALAWPNLYVVGSYDSTVATNKNIVVIKLDAATGQQKWVYRYNSPYGYFADEALAVDYSTLEKMLYVGGYSSESATNKDFFVLKLDTLGNKLYDYRRNGSANLNDECNAIKAKTMDDYAIYAAGYTTVSGEGEDFTVVKFDSTLWPVWSDMQNGSANSNDRALSMNDDAVGAVFVAGYLTNAGTNKDFAVIKYVDAGRDWTFTKDGPTHGDDEARAVCTGWYIAPTFTSYAVGYVTDTAGGVSSKDYYFVSLNGSGTQSYSWKYNGQGNGDDIGTAVQSRTGWEDLVIACGTTFRTATGNDIMVTVHEQWATDSIPDWIYLYDGGGGPNAHDYAYCVENQRQSGICFVGGSMKWGTGANNVDALAIAFYSNFPPTIPVLSAPADSTWLKDTVVTFNWFKSQEPEGNYFEYLLEIANNPAFTNSDTLWPWDSVWVDTLNDTLYWWRVKSVDWDNEFYSDWSSVWQFGFDLTVPNTPVLLNPISNVFILDTLVNFTWSSVTFKDVQTTINYIIQIDTADAFTAPIAVDTFLTTNAQFDLIGDDVYYWHVKAYDLAGNQSNYATAEHFRLDMSSPLIDSMTVWSDTINPGPYNVYAKITDVFGVDSVRMYFKRMEDPAWFPYDMTVGPGNWYFSVIPAVGMINDSVKYCLWSKDNAGRITQTDTIIFIGNYQPGVQDFADLPRTFSFGLRNNPAKGQAIFNLALPQNALITIKIYDVTGRLIDKPLSGIKSAGYYQIPWTSDANAGVYFYSLESPWQNKVGKLIIVR